MERIDLHSIVIELHLEASKHDEHTPSLHELLQRVAEEVAYNIDILTQEGFEDFVSSGFEGGDGYCDENDIGYYVWDDGECYCSQNRVASWAVSSKDELNQGYSRGEDYVVNSAITAILETRNGILRKIHTEIQRVEQIRRNLTENIQRSQGIERKYQEMSLEIVEKCQSLCRELITAFQ